MELRHGGWPDRYIPTVKELIDRIMAEAEQIIRQRLTGFLDGTVATKPARAVA
jgi:NADH:quinone reductase (non-electrogenic)